MGDRKLGRHGTPESDLLKSLMAERSKARERVLDLDLKITRELELIAEECLGVKPGSVVSFNGSEYLVSGVRTMFWDFQKPWLLGVKRKKDGSWSKREEHIYGGWKLVK